MPNMHIKVAHESPISIIKDVANMTDYCYCLVHLMENNEKYRDYFLKARNLYDREVYLDTSIFELNTSFNSDKYMDWVEKINPNAMIIPDVLEDSQATMDSWEEFTWKYKTRLDKLDARKIGVVQGKTIQELKDCYEFMSEKADMIAISFDYSYYNSIGDGEKEIERMASGRPKLIQELIDGLYWNWNKPTHLLGCALSQEFSYYVRNNIHNIRSIDTNNPIIHGLHNVKYNSTFGLKDKIKTLIADLIDVQPTADQQEIIKYNIQQFRKIVDGQM
jgi:hypothetical protein